MVPKLTVTTPKSAHYPSALLGAKGGSLFPRIWTIGNPAILNRPLLGLFCSVKCPGDLILRTYDLARAVRDAGVPVISGFHTPIEKDCLDLLLRGRQSVVICPARNISNMRLGKNLKTCIEEGRVLVLSPFDMKGKRPTAQVSEHRNRFVGVLAAAAFVAYADPGGRTEEFCKDFMEAGKSLYIFESLYNRATIEKGAIPVAPDELPRWVATIRNGIGGSGSL